jgi:hypothetical protein
MLLASNTVYTDVVHCMSTDITVLHLLIITTAVLFKTTGNEEGQLDTELLVARCLAAISRKTQLEQRSMLTGTFMLMLTLTYLTSILYGAYVMDCCLWPCCCVALPA